MSGPIRRVFLTAVPGVVLAGCGGTRGGGALPATLGTGTPAASNSAVGTPTLAGDAVLTLYNAQHEDLVRAMTTGFTQQSGIKVELRSGKDFELANQIVQEGAASPADAFVTENSPAMQVVAAKELFARVDPATLAQVPARFSPSTGDWVGVAARATVLVYNPKLLPPGDLPKSILDLGGNGWKDKIGMAPTGADFQAIVSAVVAVNGVAKATEWLQGLKANARAYQGNGAVMRAVNDGAIPAGIIYHYYWFKDRAESGANSGNTELHFFPNKDAGAFLSVSGVGVLKSSKHPREAQHLLQFLTGRQGQQILADSNALEYPIGSGVAANPKLKPFSELQPPDVDVASLNGPQVIQLMQQAGLL